LGGFNGIVDLKMEDVSRILMKFKLRDGKLLVL